jgi:hypothetical protein
MFARMVERSRQGSCSKQVRFFPSGHRSGISEACPGQEVPNLDETPSSTTPQLRSRTIFWGECPKRLKSDFLSIKGGAVRLRLFVVNTQFRIQQERLEPPSEGGADAALFD